MGLMMEPGAVVLQLDQMNRRLTEIVCDAEQALNKVETLEETDDCLAGKSYDRLRTYFYTLHIPILQGTILYGEALMQENSRYGGCINSYLAGIGYIDEDELRRSKEELERQINHVYGLIARNKGGFSDYLSCLNRTLELIEKKLKQIEDFQGASAGLYQGLDSYQSFLHRGVISIRDERFDIDSGSYDLSAIQKEWLNDMDKLWEERIRTRFFSCIRTQYGFDEETVRIMQSVYDALYQKYPDASQREIDWRFTRLMGGFVYDEGTIQNVKWDDVAGYAIDSFGGVDEYGNPFDMTEKGYFTGFLEIPERDYRLLRYHVRLQHALASGEKDYLMPNDYNEIKIDQLKKLNTWRNTCQDLTGLSFQSDEEFLHFWNGCYNRYTGKGDYAHQQITTATILASAIGKDGELSNLYLCESDKGVTEYAGWRGDAVLTPGAFGNEDYKADLDASNVTSLMKKRGLGYQEALGDYYAQLERGVSRAELFLQDTDITYVKEQIYEVFVYPDVKEQIANALDVEERIQAQQRMEDDEYLMKYLKGKVPVTYNFIRSLENRASEMGEYE